MPLFICLFVTHLFHVPGSWGILVNDRHKLILWNKIWWESASNAGDQGLIPGLGRAPGEANGNPLWYSFLEHPLGRGAWPATVRGVAELDTAERLTREMGKLQNAMNFSLLSLFNKDWVLSVCMKGIVLSAEDKTVTRVYVPWFLVSSQQRFGVTDFKARLASHSSQVLDRPCYSSQVSNGPCYSS